jgi:hypothetical protein
VAAGTAMQATDIAARTGLPTETFMQPPSTQELGGTR